MIAPPPGEAPARPDGRTADARVAFLEELSDIDTGADLARH